MGEREARVLNWRMILRSLRGDLGEHIDLPNRPDSTLDSTRRLREKSRIVHARRVNTPKRALSTKMLEDIKELGQLHMALDTHDGLSCGNNRENRGGGR